MLQLFDYFVSLRFKLGFDPQSITIAAHFIQCLGERAVLLKVLAAKEEILFFIGFGHEVDLFLSFIIF